MANPSPEQSRRQPINQAEGCRYFPPRPRLSSKPLRITALWPTQSYTAWWQRHLGLNDFPRVVSQPCPNWESTSQPFGWLGDWGLIAFSTQIGYWTLFWIGGLICIICGYWWKCTRVQSYDNTFLWYFCMHSMKLCLTVDWDRKWSVWKHFLLSR